MYFYIQDLRYKCARYFAVCFRRIARSVNVVMGANARRCSQAQNEIIMSKTELPVKKIKSRILTSYVSP